MNGQRADFKEKKEAVVLTTAAAAALLKVDRATVSAASTVLRQGLTHSEAEWLLQARNGRDFAAVAG